MMILMIGGVLWKNVIDCHSLFVVSMGALASGPVHAYRSGQSSTSVDYIIGYTASTFFLLSCLTLADHPSDHLPILAKYSFTTPSVVAKANCTPRFDWDHSALDGSCEVYAKLSDEAVLPLLDKDYTSIDEVEEVLSVFTKRLISISESTVHSPYQGYPLVNLVLEQQGCFLPMEGWWQTSKWPTSQSLKENKNEVASYLSMCRARLEHHKITKRDELFISRHPNRFKSTSSSRSSGSSILVNSAVVNDPDTVLAHWTDHFSALGSRCTSNTVLQRFVVSTAILKADSYTDPDTILDSPIALEEVEHAIFHLLCPNDLKHSGSFVKKWICQIFNHIILLEAIPSILKFVPINKGREKIMCSYRGITLTSVLAKTFEFVLLDRILPTLSDINITHLGLALRLCRVVVLSVFIQ